MSAHNSYAAVIAAAGMSSRMGRFKPLLELGGKPMIRHIADTFRAFGVDKLVVVTGNNAAALEKALPGDDIEFVRNERYAETQMFDSAKLGLGRVASMYENIFFTTADIPLFSTAVLDRLSEADGDFICPTFAGREGHPVLLRGEAAKRLLADDGDGGMRRAVERQGIRKTCVEVAERGILFDADTPEDFERIGRYLLRTDQNEVRLSYPARRA